MVSTPKAQGRTSRINDLPHTFLNHYTNARKEINMANDNQPEITSEYLNRLLEDIVNEKQHQSDSGTAVARLYKSADKSHGIHGEAMKLCVKLSKMSEEKKDDFLRAFEQYVPLLGLEVKADLVDMAEDKIDVDVAAQ